MTATPPSARDLAVRALRDRGGNVSAHLDRLLAGGGVSAAESALARELALGALRRRGTLHAVLRAFLKEPDTRLASPLREILHVALYQLLFLHRVPAFAAVNEAVSQAARFRHKRQSGFVNALLRSVARELSDSLDGAPPRAANVVPIGPRAFRKFDRAVFPDPSADPAGYLAGAFSLPAALARRWCDRFGLDGAAELAMHADVRAPLIVRVNALKASVEQAAAALAAEGIAARPHANGCSLVLVERGNVTELAAFREGLVQPQDASATAVVLAADPKPGMRVLDFCAAPGTKTTHLAERMDNRGSIVAVDVSAEKLQRVESNCRRMGVGIVETRPADQVGSLEPHSFDLVLVDSPCSNTGVLARRPEARWRFDEDALARLAKDQQFLAAAGAQFVAPGGRLVYATCSIEPEECSDVASRLARRCKALRLVAEQLTLGGGAEDPAQWHDGGYVAIFQGV